MEIVDRLYVADFAVRDCLFSAVVVKNARRFHNFAKLCRPRAINERNRRKENLHLWPAIWKGTDDMGKDDDKLMPLPMPNIELKEIDARDKGCARAQLPQMPCNATSAHRCVPGAIAAHLMSGCRGTLTWCA